MIKYKQQLLRNEIKLSLLNIGDTIKSRIINSNNLCPELKTAGGLVIIMLKSKYAQNDIYVIDNLIFEIEISRGSSIKPSNSK